MRFDSLAHLPLAAACLLGLGASFSASAGGVGAVVLGGMHTDTVYFYDSANDYAQYKQTQIAPNMGGGVEVLLGDRDDRITGVFRGYFVQDAAQKDPATLTEIVSPDDVVANVRTIPRNIGVGTFGLEWGFLGSTDSFQLIIVTALGSGFLTTDHSEFMLGELGGGFTYRFGRNLEAYAEVVYQARYRKGFAHGSNGYAGARFRFD
jgi:hypothetical protein